MTLSCENKSGAGHFVPLFNGRIEGPLRAALHSITLKEAVLVKESREGEGYELRMSGSLISLSNPFKFAWFGEIAPRN